MSNSHRLVAGLGESLRRWQAAQIINGQEVHSDEPGKGPLFALVEWKQGLEYWSTNRGRNDAGPVLQRILQYNYTEAHGRLQ